MVVPLSKKKKLFCTFIDFKAAFDKVWRTGLWTKIIKNNVNGKCFVVIKNMYENIKSCVTNNGNYFDFFPCRIGVRQGENLHSFLFALYINDIEEFFENRNISSLHMIDEMKDNLLDVFIKLFILLYADDTVIFSETREEMQNMLDVFTDYCKQWKLYVNIDKTKVVVFSKRRYEANHKFKVIGEKIQFSDNYCYLGVLFNYNSNITNAKKRLIVQSQKALYSVYYKIRNIKIPIDLQLKIFDALVAPILLYGSEVLGLEKNDNIEKVHLQFLKKNIFRCENNYSTFSCIR